METTAGLLELGKFSVKPGSTLYGCNKGSVMYSFLMSNDFRLGLKQRLVDMFIQEWSGLFHTKIGMKFIRLSRRSLKKEVYFKH